MSLAVEYRRQVLQSESFQQKDDRKTAPPSTPSQKNQLSVILELSPTSPIINGFRQSTLNFSKLKEEPRHVDVENIEPTEIVVKSLSVNDISAAENIKTRGRPKKQTLLHTIDQESTTKSVPPKRTQKNVKPARSRRGAAPIRRSVSTSNLPDPINNEPVAKPTRQTANSVSPKKQIRSEDTRKSCVKTTKYQQTQLGFGIRRTARQFAKDLKKEQENDVVSAILNKEENGMKMVMTELKGRGVISTRFFASGEFIVEYAGELISDSEARMREIEYKKNPNLGSYMFFFPYGGQRFCVDATKETGRMGRLFNHSRLHPNCVVKIIPVDGLPRLTLFAKHDITAGEELLYDYGDRDKESLLSHPWLKC